MKTTPKESPRLVRAILERMQSRGELIPGAAATLSKIWSVVPSPSHCLGEVIEYLIGDGKAYLTKQGKIALADTPTTQFVLERLPLRKGSAEELYGEWAADLASHEPKYQARRTLERLQERGMAYHLQLDGDGSPSDGERRVRAGLHVFRFWFRDGLDLDNLAARWDEELGRLPFNRLCWEIARKLESPSTSPAIVTDAGHFRAESFAGWFEPISTEESNELIDRLEGEIEHEREAPRRELLKLQKELAAAEAEGRDLRAKLHVRETETAPRQVGAASVATKTS